MQSKHIPDFSFDLKLVNLKNCTLLYTVNVKHYLANCTAVYETFSSANGNAVEVNLSPFCQRHHGLGHILMPLTVLRLHFRTNLSSGVKTRNLDQGGVSIVLRPLMVCVCECVRGSV